MCGIAGLVDFRGRKVRKETIKIMTDAIKHRGPDGEGQWVHENVGLGHRRLAIIDLTDAAHQPMSTEDGRYILTYNGEIYNYKELKKELEELGVKFCGQSDSEVLLHSLVVWKEKALIKLNGMFAFAMYDKVEGRLLLGRDRYGIKPLYYSIQDGYLSFGSEQKAIESRKSFESKLDKEALVEYLTFQNIFTDRTLQIDIKLLGAGHYVLVDTRRGQQFNPVQYWDYHFFEGDDIHSENEYMEELDRLFQQAVHRTLVADVEIGSYLSGGMDSGSIVAIAARSNPRLKSFTVGFDLSSTSAIERLFDERSMARAMSTRFQTEHHEITLDSVDMETSLRRLVHHLEEPRVGQSYPNFYAAKLASNYVKVVLSGAGGDELFGGYPWRYYPGANSSNFESFIDRYYLYWHRLVDNKSLTKMIEPIGSEIVHVQTRDTLEGIIKRHNGSFSDPRDFLNHSLYFEAKTFLHSLFVVEDKLSMAHSVEARVPFMDNDLVDFACRLPVSLKVPSLTVGKDSSENLHANRNKLNHHRTVNGKYILRKTMEKYVSSTVAMGAKQGFSSPDATWFRDKSSEFVRQTLLVQSNPLYELLDYNEVHRNIQLHFDGKENKRLLIWSLMYLSVYLSDR